MRAAADWWAVVTLQDGSLQSLAGTSLLRFRADGLVVEQRDAWGEAEGRHEPDHDPRHQLHGRAGGLYLRDTIPMRIAAPGRDLRVSVSATRADQGMLSRWAGQAPSAQTRTSSYSTLPIHHGRTRLAAYQRHAALKQERRIW
jgi:hypothetical protein